MTQKEKLEEAKRLYETANADQRYVLESLFPELKESEDERIRKGLIKQFKALNTIDIWGGLKREDILSWLEKQGEKDILEDATLDSNEDGLIAETIRYYKEQKSVDNAEKKELKKLKEE